VAALELIAESGLDSLTLLAVAERAGVSRATAYREFGAEAVLDGDVELNLVETVAALAAPIVAARSGEGLALPPAAAAEVVVRIVLSHALIQHSGLTDEQIADTATRAVTVGGR